MNCTVLPPDVMRVDEAWKIQTELASPRALSVSVVLRLVLAAGKL